METHFGRLARQRPFSPRQMELVVGSLLGDGTLLRTTAGYCFRAHHGLAQCDLVDWKYGELKAFVRTPPRRCGAGYLFRTITHPDLTTLRDLFYSGSRKVVPIEFVRKYLSPFALAVWIMDDGAADGNQLRLNTQSFTLKEAEALAALLSRRFGVPVTVNLDKGMPRLRFAAAGMRRLDSIVGQHLLPQFRYKLPATGGIRTFPD